MARSSPAWRDDGVTKPMLLCRCTSLYQATKRATHARASSTVAKPFEGYSGQYFKVRKSDSAYALSSETRGRLKDGTMPSLCIVASIVAPFIGPPLSE